MSFSSNLCAFYALSSGRRLVDWLCSTSSLLSPKPDEQEEEDSGLTSPQPLGEVKVAALCLCSSLLDIGILIPLEDETGKERFKVS